MNPLVQLHNYGQSFWYDNMRRQYLFDGTIYNLIANDGARGMTSNPSIFQKAIGQSDDYDGQIRQQVKAGADTNTAYEALAIRDIQIACDLFSNLYEESERGDGYISLEVSPYLANDTEGTIAEARRLFGRVNRPNLMIKIPATAEGIPAIEQVISAGINVNVTLMFNMAHYEAVANAYIKGLNHFVADGGDASTVASVASFFISRVDVRIDPQLKAIGTPEASALLGKIAIANAKVVYKRYKEIFHGADFAELKAVGANAQRVLWASTGTKDPSYSDTLYVDTLIGAETVNTMPPKTIDAFRDHGAVSNAIEDDVAGAEAALKQLAGLGIDIDTETEALQTAGVASFAKSFDTLMTTLSAKMATY
ncbi:MAG TPA: transaldolase [Anaerolineae bacterium]|nr:transaldolase [Anaerolineae bacterium]